MGREQKVWRGMTSGATVGKWIRGEVEEPGDGTMESMGTWWTTLGPGFLSENQVGRVGAPHTFVDVEFGKEDGFYHDYLYT
jgi:hypothetical protein